MSVNKAEISATILELEKSFNERWSVADSGDFAVLAYNLNTHVLDDSGDERQLRAWIATQAYRLIAGEWRIVHSPLGVPADREGSRRVLTVHGASAAFPPRPRASTALRLDHTGPPPRQTPSFPKERTDDKPDNSGLL